MNNKIWSILTSYHLVHEYIDDVFFSVKEDVTETMGEARIGIFWRCDMEYM